MTRNPLNVARFKKPLRLPSLSYLLGVAALASVYFATAKLGLSFSPISGFATVVWPPTGIALASLWLFGQRLWPGIFIGAFLVNLLTGASLGIAFGIALGNTLEAIVGVYLLH